ncbi:MAG: SOS response-associated peptidase, partial [Planctomycetota bacterium]
EFRAMTWGLIPSWAKDPAIGSKMINARAETLAEKPSYRNAFKHRRCLVVADGFYEWKTLPKGKQPYHICMADRQPFGIAGLWENWQGPNGNVVQSCTLITTQPNRLLADIHDRMPVILPPERFGEWLSPDDHDVARLSQLLRPFSETLMRAFPVSTRVNAPTFDDPACMAPTGDIAPPEHHRASPQSP